MRQLVWTLTQHDGCPYESRTQTHVERRSQRRQRSTHQGEAHKEKPSLLTWSGTSGLQNYEKTNVCSLNSQWWYLLQRPKLTNALHSQFPP